MTKIRIVGDNALSNKCEQVNSVDDVKDVIDALWDKVTESNDYLLTRLDTMYPSQ